MASNSDHPMLWPLRPMIVTRPINRLGSDSASAIQRGDKGIPLDGLGRSGKTWALDCLAILTRWRPFPMAFFTMDYGSPQRSSESYFSASVLSTANQKIVRTATGAEGMDRAGNVLLERTKYLKEPIIAFVIHEANRLTAEDIDHLVTLDNRVERARKRLFCILNYQTDANDAGEQSINTHFPSQKFGRFYAAHHHFTGLIWGPKGDHSPDLEHCDVTMAIHQYEEGNFIPEHIACPCLAYFAPNAWTKGYRITSQMELIRECVEDLRVQHGLQVDAPWPMQTFEHFMYFMLVHIAWRDPNFREFTKVQILQALHWSFFVELEQSYQAGPLK